MPGGWGDLELLAKIAAAHPVLTRERETELVRQAKAGDKRAAELLVRHNLRLVFKLAGRYRWCTADFGDLVQEGLRGFAHGIERFDRSRGLRLTSYAMWWAQSFIRKVAVSGPMSLVRSPRNPKAQILARLADYSMDEIRTGTDGEELSTLGTRMASPAPTPEQVHIDQDCALKVRRRLAGMELRPVERDILYSRLMKNPADTLLVIGARNGVSRERIRQLEVRLREKLRDRLAPLADAA